MSYSENLVLGKPKPQNGKNRLSNIQPFNNSTQAEGVSGVGVG